MTHAGRGCPSWRGPTWSRGRGRARPRWGFAGDSQLYQRFWENAIRWLIRDPALSFLRIETPESEYSRGQKVPATIGAVGPDYQPLKGAEINVAVTSLASANGKPEPVASHNGRSDEAGEVHLE